ncbi:MAG: SulP family inorganic anion transporter [Chromatiales bacterium]|jgi:MFS superfamily sulfate permease-like transporter|nr:SulP family inorganic anion transporter [Chromatiales bacterium]
MSMKTFSLPTLASANRDVPAGIVVFLVALPLCLGIALASGAPLFAGVITGVVGGMVLAFVSGSELSVSGPAAGLTVIVAGAIASLGSFQLFTVAVLLSGLFQLALGFARAGGIGDFIPNSVIKGMLAAIGIVIILKQLPHALGYDRDFLGDESFSQPGQADTFTDLVSAFTSPTAGAIVISLVALVLMLLWERPFMKRQSWTLILPAPLACVVVGTLMNELFGSLWPAGQLTAENQHLVQLPVIGSAAEFFGMFTAPDLSALLLPDVWIVAATIAIVGSIETLLCIEATDKLDPEKRISDPNRELRGQGIGNFVCGLLGGLPMTSVIVRSSANVYAGARTRLSTLVHGLVLLLAVVFIGGLLNRVPLATLATVLIVVGYKLSSREIIVSMWRQGLTQFIPFIVTVVGIVFTDLLKGIAIGLLTGLFFVIRSNYHAAVTLVNQDDNWLLRLNKDTSFIHKIELKRKLRKIPDRARLIVDGTKALYIDGDIYETLREFEAGAAFRGIEIQYYHFFDKQLVRSTASQR